MDFKDKLIAAAVANFNVPGFATDMLDDVINEALDNLVKRTDTPFDDVAKNALYPVLAAELKKLLNEQWQKLLPEPTPEG